LETYPTEVITDGALKFGTSMPVCVTVKAGSWNEPPQSYRKIPDPADGGFASTSLAPHGDVVCAVGAGITVSGIVKVVIACADTTNVMPISMRIIGLAKGCDNRLMDNCIIACKGCS
jgi:hypothetical protein